MHAFGRETFPSTKPSLVELAVMLLLLAVMLVTSAQHVASQNVPLLDDAPMVTGLSSSSCNVGVDGSLYSCGPTALITVTGTNFCQLNTAHCALTLGNFSVTGYSIVEQNSTSVVFLVGFGAYSQGQWSTWWTVNEPLRYEPYPLRIIAGGVVSAGSTLGVNFALSPAVVALSGCAVDTTDRATGIVSTSGCINGVSNLTVVTSTLLDLKMEYRVLMYGAVRNNGYPSTSITALPTTPFSISFQLPFLDWSAFNAPNFTVIVNEPSTVSLYQSLVPQPRLSYALDTPVFYSLFSSDCSAEEPAVASPGAAVANVTSPYNCGAGAVFYIAGAGFEPGYDVQLDQTGVVNQFVSQTCDFVNSTAYLCSLKPRNPRSTAAQLGISIQRRPGEYFSTGFSIAIIGPLSLTCVTGCASNVNCTAQDCQPNDVVHVRGTGWTRTFGCTTFTIGNLPPILTGYVDNSTGLMRLVLPSWYTLRFTPDEPYPLTVLLDNQLFTAPNALWFDYPPSPVVWSVSGCPLQLGNRTSNCTLPSQDQPVVLTLTGQNLFYQSLFVYLGGIYCPGDYFYNSAHYADQPVALLRVKCYQAAFLTDTWLNLVLTLADTPFDTVLVGEAVWFTSPPTNATNEVTTITINNTNNTDLLYLLFLLIIPITVAIIAFVYVRHLQPYRAALLLLGRLRAAQREAGEKHESSYSSRQGSAEMAIAASHLARYQPRLQTAADERKDAELVKLGDESAVCERSLVGLAAGTEPDSSSDDSTVVSRMQPLV